MFTPAKKSIIGERRMVGPPRVQLSQNEPSWLMVPPTCHQKLLVEFMCQLVLSPVPVLSPSVFQFNHSLKFIWNERYTFVGLRNCSENQVACVCSSARCMNPRSLISNPGERRPRLVSKRVMPPPNFANFTSIAPPDRDVAVAS